MARIRLTENATAEPTPPSGQVSFFAKSDSELYIKRSDGSEDVLATSGSLPQFFETVSKNLKSYPYVFNYTAGVLTSIEYDLGGGLEITKTLNYTAGVLTSVVLSGDTPSGIDLTKTLTYTLGVLSGISYS